MSTNSTYNDNEPRLDQEERQTKTILVRIEIEVPKDEEYNLQKLINMTTAYAGSILEECKE